MGTASIICRLWDTVMCHGTVHYCTYVRTYTYGSMYGSYMQRDAK